MGISHFVHVFPGCMANYMGFDFSRQWRFNNFVTFFLTFETFVIFFIYLLWFSRCLHLYFVHFASHIFTFMLQYY
ncbi:hypothetical protein CLOBOL_00506 [Enterocloster bolteae ATCC BAA-613]|uniref:Uncharacterized protein n=1 Tax=Enterocloster bolteae (strain ATCC BAA-613 / DSM 15670 / CCUG 46953 / JCM 12243 / WAL 16351) TaxID=411902 RepID=A8RHU2_ENTBW|nr:hypothetical protein CLOBOL_00506 [Enterocloster bolteae ATCC BAA-613]